MQFIVNLLPALLFLQLDISNKQVSNTAKKKKFNNLFKFETKWGCKTSGNKTTPQKKRLTMLNLHDIIASLYQKCLPLPSQMSISFQFLTAGIYRSSRIFSYHPVLGLPLGLLSKGSDCNQFHLRKVTSHCNRYLVLCSSFYIIQSTKIKLRKL